MAEIQLKPVVSEAISAYHYDPEYKELLIRFRTGAFYVYHDCPKSLADRLDKRHPWHRIFAEVKALPMEKVSQGIKIEPTRVRVKKKNKKKEA